LLDNSDSGHRSDFSVPFHPADLQLDSSWRPRTTIDYRIGKNFHKIFWYLML
jgi:hypothetical protein